MISQRCYISFAGKIYLIDDLNLVEITALSMIKKIFSDKKIYLLETQYQVASWFLFLKILTVDITMLFEQV